MYQVHVPVHGPVAMLSGVHPKPSRSTKTTVISVRHHSCLPPIWLYCTSKPLHVVRPLLALLPRSMAVQHPQLATIAQCRPPTFKPPHSQHVTLAP